MPGLQFLILKVEWDLDIIKILIKAISIIVIDQFQQEIMMNFLMNLINNLFLEELKI